MSRNRLKAQRLTPVEAGDLWGRSDEASAFTQPECLEQLVDEVEWWGVERSGEIVAAWPLVRPVAGGEIGPPPFCYYVGPMFARDMRHRKYHRYWAIYSEALAALISAVTAEHERLRFTLPLGITDVRVLQWWNFDHPQQVGFSVTPRYTARIDLSKLPDESALLESFSRSRRRSIEHWLTSPPAIIDGVDQDRVVELHDQTLGRNGAVADHARREALKRVLALANSGRGSSLGFIPRGERDVQAVIILLHGPTESSSIFRASSPTWRSRGLAPWAVWHGLLLAKSLGKKWFDFNGANSPARAADKHFFNASAQLYFDCTFARDGSWLDTSEPGEGGCL